VKIFATGIGLIIVAILAAQWSKAGLKDQFREARKTVVTENKSKALDIASGPWKVVEEERGLIKGTTIAYVNLRIERGDQSYRLVARNGDEGFNVLDRKKKGASVEFTFDINEKLSWHPNYGTEENALLLLKLK